MIPPTHQTDTTIDHNKSILDWLRDLSCVETEEVFKKSLMTYQIIYIYIMTIKLLYIHHVQLAFNQNMLLI